MDSDKLRQKTCCFTGHRDIPMHMVHTLAAHTAATVRHLIIDNDVRFFGVGGALGYDTLAADVLFRLRETEFPHIKIILVYPFEGFFKLWPPEYKAAYARRLPHYNKTVCVSSKASREAYLARNRHLIDHSAYCIAYCTRSYGGSAYTLRYARTQQLEVFNLAFS